MKWGSLSTKITVLFLAALLLNGAAIISINLYQTGTVYTNEYDQEIHEIAAKFRSNSLTMSAVAEEFNQLSSYHIYLKLAYEQEVDRQFMSASNVRALRQTPNQTVIIKQNNNNYIAAIFPLVMSYPADSASLTDLDELIIMKQIPLLNERSTSILRYSILSVCILSLPLLIVLVIFLRRFTKPILEMSKISESFAEGDFGQQVQVRSQDELGQLALALNQMAARLKAKEEARDTFLAGVSHELRTPLTSLKANTNGIIEGIVPPEQVTRFLQANVEEIERMIRMVNDLILVSTFEQKLMLHMQPISLQTLLHNVVQAMRLFAQNKQVQFQVQVEEALHVTLDQSKMTQVLMNLMQNAIKHSPHEGTVLITLRRSAQSAIIAIRDEGSGFREEQLPHLFERFYRDQHSTGLGLGLYISHKIMMAHQGLLTVRNHPDGGAVVELVFSIN